MCRVGQVTHIPPHMDMETGLCLKPRPIPPPLVPWNGEEPPTPVGWRCQSPQNPVLKRNLPSLCRWHTSHDSHQRAHQAANGAACPRRPTPTSAAGGGPARCAHSALASFRPGVASGHAPLRATLCARDTRHAAGPVSRLSSFEPGDKTGLRLSPHLAPIAHSRLGGSQHGLTSSRAKKPSKEVCLLSWRHVLCFCRMDAKARE